MYKFNFHSMSNENNRKQKDSKSYLNRIFIIFPLEIVYDTCIVATFDLNNNITVDKVIPLSFQQDKLIKNLQREWVNTYV